MQKSTGNGKHGQILRFWEVIPCTLKMEAASSSKELVLSSNGEKIRQVMCRISSSQHYNCSLTKLQFMRPIAISSFIQKPFSYFLPAV
jgi:hypothetical protein